mgnify:CR=1 FL=1
MIGTKGYFLKIIAMSGAIDLEGIRIFYQTHNGRRVKDKNMKILRENGYIQKAVFRRKSYYHLTQKGKILYWQERSRIPWTARNI